MKKKTIQETIDSEYLDRMDGLISQQDLTALLQVITKIKEAFIDEGFEEEDVEEFLTYQIKHSETEDTRPLNRQKEREESEMNPHMASLYESRRPGKQMINEAFRLQQLAGLTPINEMDGDMSYNNEEQYGDQEEEQVDTVTMDVPLFIRMLEFAKEDAKDDQTLHSVTEKVIELSKQGQELTMADYNSIVGDQTKQNNIE